MRKKRILFLTDYAGINTGFGKNVKLLLKYLYETDKYELCNACCGLGKNNQDYSRFPWKTIGVIPDDSAFHQRMQQDPNFARIASYGEPEIGNIVAEFKPDVVFAIQDSWGALFVADKPFFKKIPTVCWITFDSLPLLKDTIDKAKSIKDYWCWSDFAEHEFKKLGYDHVKTQYPVTNTHDFFPLCQSEKEEIRKKHGIDKDTIIFGFVFRNQLRKLVGTLIAGYAEFLKRNPDKEKKSKLLLHTNFSEGWDIMRFTEQYGVPKENILCTYVCKDTKEYFIKPYEGQDKENPKTKKKSLITANIQIGVSDAQFNEIYNIMDGYIHPVTSGGCELPIIEAALTEKIVSTCDYSFGWSVIHNNKNGSIPMDYSFYNEPPTNSNTQFLKSQPSPSSIANIMQKICNMKPDTRRKMEVASRAWALANYDVKINGPKIEEFIDKWPLIENEEDWKNQDNQEYNDKAQIENIEDNQDWIIHLYKSILGANDIDGNNEGVIHWLTQIENGVPRTNIENYFRKVASDEIQKKNPITMEDLFEKSDRENGKKRILIVQPQSAGDILLVTSLLKSIRSKFNPTDWSLYFACQPEFADILAGNEFIDKVVPYHQSMDNQLYMEGRGKEKGYVDICLNPYFPTQRLLSYTHNGYEVSQLDQKF